VIVVRVELWSAISGHKTELARMVVDNIGVSANMQKGDYRVRTLRGRSEEALTKAMLTALRDKGGVQREGKVLGHARLQLHIWNLIAKALTGLGYGKE
jgi:hypothetical protein